MENSKEKINYEAAKNRVEQLKGFYIHLLVYLVVNALILYANYQYLSPTAFFLEPQNFSTAFFWGIGLLAHGLHVFAIDLLFGRKWEERKIKELMDKEKKSTDQ